MFNGEIKVHKGYTNWSMKAKLQEIRATIQKQINKARRIGKARINKLFQCNHLLILIVLCRFFIQREQFYFVEK